MIKTFCDCCDNEITKENTLFPMGERSKAEIRGKKGSRYEKLIVDIVAVRDDIGNYGDWCKYCVLDAISNLDDRPKARMLALDVVSGKHV